MFIEVQLSTDINDNIDHENEYIRKCHRTFVKKFKEHLKLLSTIYYYDTIRHITTIDSLDNVRK